MEVTQVNFRHIVRNIRTPKRRESCPFYSRCEALPSPIAKCHQINPRSQINILSMKSSTCPLLSLLLDGETTSWHVCFKHAEFAHPGKIQTWTLGTAVLGEWSPLISELAIAELCTLSLFLAERGYLLSWDLPPSVDHRWITTRVSE